MHRLAIAILVSGLALIAVQTAGSSEPVGDRGPVAKLGRSSVALSPAQEKARARAIRRCKKTRVEAKRRACIRRVNRKFAGEPVQPPPVGPEEEVLVRDKYFLPTMVEIPKGGWVRWEWGSQNVDPHNVTLLDGPRGVSPYDFETPLSPAVNYTFRRSFRIAGTYRFACSLHHLMEMTVEVRD